MMSWIINFAMWMHCGTFKPLADWDMSKVTNQYSQSRIINYLQKKAFKDIDFTDWNITDDVSDKQYIAYSMFKEIDWIIYNAYTIIDVKNRSYARIRWKDIVCNKWQQLR
jgi:hypothetical protein